MTRAAPRSPTIWTIGYEGRAQHDVVGMLVDAGIELLADIRIRPQSRKPGLSKSSLSIALGEAGIAYEHRRDLGTPLDIRALFRAGDLADARRQYHDYVVAEARADLEWLARTAGERRTAMLCFEFDPKTCHRRVLAELLAERYGVTAVDL